MTQPPPIAIPKTLHRVLAKHTGFLLSRLGMVSQKRFGELLESLDLTTRMWGALNVLDHEGPLTQHALGRMIAMDPSSMVATIDELEARGLVERRRHPTDRRAHALHVTARGRHDARARSGARRSRLRTNCSRRSPRPSASSCTSCCSGSRRDARTTICDHPMSGWRCSIG